MLNSQAPFVTATRGPRPKPRNAGTPYPEVTGPVCRFPSPALVRQALAFSASAPVLVLGTVTGDRSPFPFHGPLASARAAKRPHHAFSRLSPLRYSAAFSAWTGRGHPPAPAWPSQRRRERGLRCRTYPGGAGILTGFPFGGYELRAALGPTNCWLTKHRQQTLALSALGILTPVCCYYRRDPRSIRVHRSSRPDFYPVWTPAYPVPSSEGAARVSAPGFSPDSFSGPPSSAGELLRTL